jgi:hypothetical protein
MGVKEQARSDQRSCNGAHSAPNEEGRRGAHSAIRVNLREWGVGAPEQRS